MQYDTSNSLDKNRAIEKFKYLHLILSWYALEMGETLEYVKVEIFKKLVNPELFVYEFLNRKTGEVRDELKSSTVLDTKEMTTAIERFRNFSSHQCGIYLPEPSDLMNIREMERQINNQKHYL